MPNYTYPGVYVEEIDTGNKPIEGVSTSTAGFLGIAERGPAEPTLITSFGDFQRNFGSYFREQVNNVWVDRFLAYAVEGFFLNGGQTCYVQRVFRKDPVNAANSATPAWELSDNKMRIEAIGPGLWGNRLAYQIEDASLSDPNLFKLTIRYWADAPPADLVSSPTMTEVFDNLSSARAASTFYESAISGLSTLVTVTQSGAGRPQNQISKILANAGADGAAILQLIDFEGDESDPEHKTGLKALADIDDISILCCPDEFYFGARDQTITDAIVAQCEALKYRFAILQSPVSQPPNGANLPFPSARGYAAYYYPWMWITNPITGTSVLIPPGGHMAGIYARSDTNRGVHKDPANEQILGIDQLQLQINNSRQGTLNPLGVNCLRFFRGSGNLVWGGRTTSADPDWKYINVRRLFIFIEKSIERGTQWVVFEPNDAPLWARVTRSVSDFLTTLWLNGMLQGTTKEQAFFVKCDRSTMTQADIDNGRLIMVIGIAPVKPAEFVIFRIGQWDGGSSVTEG
jgi:phage tail sheath protein FI